MKKAQVWYIDFAVGLLIFMVAITAYFSYAYSESVEQRGDMSELIIDAKMIATSLISKGYPYAWNSSNVTRIGLTDGNYRIQQGKLDAFNNFSYKNRSSLLGTTKDYYFYLEYPNGTKFNTLGWNGENATQLVQVTRIVIYNSTPVRMVYHLWQ